MARVALRSSVLTAADYDATTRLLTLEFASGKVYRYADVPEDCFAGLCTAKSAGTFYGKEIRNKYKAPDDKGVLS